MPSESSGQKSPSHPEPPRILLCRCLRRRVEERGHFVADRHLSPSPPSNVMPVESCRHSHLAAQSLVIRRRLEAGCRRSRPRSNTGALDHGFIKTVEPMTMDAHTLAPTATLARKAKQTCRILLSIRPSATVLTVEPVGREPQRVALRISPWRRLLSRRLRIRLGEIGGNTEVSPGVELFGLRV
jgi:hypothetical protein